jgi:hypothetical protein
LENIYHKAVLNELLDIVANKDDYYFEIFDYSETSSNQWESINLSKYYDDISNQIDKLDNNNNNNNNTGKIYIYFIQNIFIFNIVYILLLFININYYYY